MRKPRHFKGNAASGIDCGAMALYLAHRPVPDNHTVTAAKSYLDERTMDWHTIALGKEEQPEDWEDFKETLLRHFRARNFGQDRDHLGRIRQASTVQEYLLESSEALAECPGLPEDEKKEIFVDCLRRSIAPNIRGHERLTTTQSY